MKMEQMEYQNSAILLVQHENGATSKSAIIK